MVGAPLLVSLPGHEWAGARLADALSADLGAITFRRFPDSDYSVRVETPCTGRDIVLFVNLYRPDTQMIPLLSSAQALRDAGAHRVVLVTPYLPYMRQDAPFQPGEMATSRVFAKLLSYSLDGLITVDPHLDRCVDLDDVYSIPTMALHAAPIVANWIYGHIDRPVIVGSDSESDQWVRNVGHLAGAPHFALAKTRRGDRNIEVTVPPFDDWLGYTPVLVNDTISTARAMIETVRHLVDAGYPRCVCIGIHGLFAEHVREELEAAGAVSIVTCNTIEHPTNAIDITGLLADGVRTLLEAGPKLVSAQEM